MNKLIWFTTFFLLFLVFVIPALLAGFIKVIPFNHQPGYSVENKLSIYGNRVFIQKFTSQESNLTGVGISLGNPNLKNKKDIILTLYDQGGGILRSSRLNGLNLEDGDFVKFAFEIIPDSKGKEYQFNISSPDAGEGEVVYVFHTNTTPFWIKEATYVVAGKPEKVEGGLPFVTYHKPESKWGLVRNIYIAWLKRIF